MKKILLILTLLLFSSTAFAAAINKSGFVDKKLKVNKNLEVGIAKSIIINNKKILTIKIIKNLFFLYFTIEIKLSFNFSN